MAYLTIRFLLLHVLVLLFISGFLLLPTTTAWEPLKQLPPQESHHHHPPGLTSFYYGPVLTNEPPQQVSFANDTGLWITCSAQASPAPQIQWIEDSSGLPLLTIDGLREVFANGTLHILPFSVQSFRSDVHQGDLRCLTSNPVGTVISRRIRFRGVVRGNWKPVLENVVVARGNVAPFLCRVDENSRDFLSISGWSSSTSFTPITSSSSASSSSSSTGIHQDRTINNLGFLPIIYGPRYSLTSSGDLLVSDTNSREFQGKFRCQVTHELTGEIRYSDTAQLQIIEPERNEPVKLVYASPPSIRVQVDDEIRIGCVAHGNPPPTYRWFRRDRESSNSLVPIEGSYGSHLLHIQRASLSDSGIYVAVAYNTLGEIRRDFAIQVTSPLSLHVSPQRQEVNSGSDVLYNCSVSGHPVNEVRWLKDGKRLFPTERIRNPAQHILHISSVTRDDQAVYQCFAFNDNDMAQAAAQLTVSGEAPVFRYTFIEQTVSAGSDVSLKCVIRGYPTPTVSWLIDHEAVSNELLSTNRLTYGSYLDRNGDVITHLNLSHVTAQQSSEYVCQGLNSLGQISHRAWLNVYGNPVAKPPKNMTAVAGLPIKLNCPVGGYPLHSFQWTRYSPDTTITDILYSRSGVVPKGVSLPSSLRQKVDPTGSLLLDHVERATDEGLYVCDAESKQGRHAQGVLTLNVIKPPEIAPFQFPPNLREGMRAQVSCSIISGDLPILIRWYKDHQMIQSGDIQTIQQTHDFASNLLFTNITAEHNGLYTCLVSNDASTTNYTARLIVKVEPAWTREPHDLNIRKGVSAFLACQASGYPEVSIRWLVEMKATGKGPTDFIPLSYNPRVGLTVTPNGTLSILNADEQHEGHYICQATNGIGPGKSRKIFIRVDVPAYFRVKEINQTARVGEDVTILCDVEGDLPIQVTWGSAKIHSFLDDSISSPPETSGAMAMATATATATRTTDKKAIIRNTPKINGLGSELHIKNIQRIQSDTYYCRSSNAYGGDTLAIHLRVKERPEPPKEAVASEVKSRTVLVKLVGGHDGGSQITRFIAQYKMRNEEWRLAKNFTLESSHHENFLLRDLRPSHTYIVRFFAVNEIGTSDPSREIFVETQDEAPTAPPLDVLAESNSSTSIILTWNPPLESHMNGKILGYHINWRSTAPPPGGGAAAGAAATGTAAAVATVMGEGGRHQLPWRVWTHKDTEPRLVLLRKLHPFSRYEVTIRAFNRIGPGPPSPRIIVLTSEGVPEGAPQDVKCVAISSRSLKVRWTPPIHNLRNGHIVGYKVHYHLISRAAATAASSSSSSAWPIVPPATSEVKRTTNPDTNFSGLTVAGNYSIRISAYTRKGNGLSTLPIYCSTNSEAPGPPEAVKVLVSTSTSLIVSWLPPRFPNGIVSKYNVYVRSVDTSTREVRVNTVHVGKRESGLVTEAISWELRGLREETSHEVWIAAVNSQNSQMEGESSPSAIQTTASRVGARILPFGQEVFLPPGKGVTFSCAAVGLPAPSRSWTFGLHKLAFNSTKWSLLPNGNLQIFSTTSAEVGNYTCQVENLYGKDEITYSLKLRSQPSLPYLMVAEKLHNELNLIWEYREVSPKPSDLYLKWKGKKESRWRTVYPDDDDDENFYALKNLTCGTTYEILVGYYDGIREYFESKAIEVTTLNQGLPNLSQEDVLVRLNSTAATLRFSPWIYGSCPATGISIEMKEKSETHWNLLYFTHTPSEVEYLMANLKSTGRYEVRVVGENTNGKQTSAFTFESMDPNESKPSSSWGVKNGANDPFQNDHSNFLGQDGMGENGSNSWDLHVVVPIVSGIICTLAMLVCLGVVIQRRRYMGYRTASHHKSKSSLTEFYGTVMRPCSESDDGCQHGTAANNQVYFPTPQRKLESFVNHSEEDQGGGGDGGGETYYEICPYATFSMPAHPNRNICLEGPLNLKNASHHLVSNSGGGAGVVGNSYYCPMPINERKTGLFNPKDFHGPPHRLAPSHGSSNDVFNLEISCISNQQQTLPLGSGYDQETSFDAYSLRRSRDGGHHDFHSDSDDDNRKPVPIRYKNRREILHNRGDSSTESAENSPLPAKRRSGHHRSSRGDSIGHRRKKSLVENPSGNSPRWNP